MADQTSTTAVPDLQAILATLAQYSAQNAAAAPATGTDPSTPQPEDASQQNRGVTSLPAEREQPAKSFDPRLPRPQGRSATSTPKPMIDPATITVWPEALRCVTKIGAQNPQFAVSIKRMMKDQRANEMRWYSERQNLKHVHANRAAETAKAESILKSLNQNSYEPLPELETPEEKKERELAEFDRKIYAAQETMAAAMTAELKSLGVPFFGASESLIVPDDRDLSESKLPDGHPKYSPLVTRSELMALQGKMVDLLEDLYRD
ncbi:hypothetical protein CB0940_05974 [Cercospora beticola]|uniref:Uncharacterized protein n=1 Tax=Cercospora beticola TaxID=122368 RepID=A0A2G5HZT2_CERBT|nr:hypothetical protein CB0940_05974 [Cercospora beticola]PIA98011.1 hypothetical protein CB0940_05974 [Cercospora beticola]WPA98576.1 hypothetical protein RHO25_003188 [Cercospora beticola]